MADYAVSLSRKHHDLTTAVLRVSAGHQYEWKTCEQRSSDATDCAAWKGPHGCTWLGPRTRILYRTLVLEHGFVILQLA